MRSIFRLARVLPATALAAAFCLPMAAAQAQDYPSKPVRVIVGMAPGGSNDTVARLVSAELSKSMKQPFIVENKPGANSVIATTELSKSAPDGHTLMLVISSHVTNTLLYPKLAYTLDDFAPVSLIADTPFILVANPGFKPDSVAELVTLAKAEQGAIDFGSPGLGSTQHISLELMNQLAGTKMNHIPYKGGAPAQSDVLGGVIPLIFATPAQSLPFVKENKLKALGVSSRERLALLPDVPTIAESGIDGYEATVWFGIIAPKGTPQPVVDRLSKEIARVVATDEVRNNLQGMGLDPVGSDPAQFQQLLDQELDKWSEVIKTSGLKFE